MRSIVGGLLNRSPVPFIRDRLFTPVSPGSGNMEQHLGAMSAQSTLFAIVDRIASSIAAVTWRLYRGTGETRVEVDPHPALTVWNKPNPFYTQSEFVETIQQHYELTGEWWWAIGRSNLLSGAGPPVELWPVRPDRMRPVKHPTEFISGYVYGIGTNEVPLRLEDVVFNKRPNPLDPYRGIGPIGTLLVDIEGEAAASAFNTQFFRSGAEPGGIIEVDQRLTDPEFDEMVARWESQHKGVGNAHRVAVLEQGQWKDRRYTQRDMQFEQLRRFSRETFRQAWGFPKPLLGDVEDVNRANAEAAEVVFSRWLLVPRLNKLRTSLNDDFLPQFGSLGQGYEFDYDPVIPPNATEIRDDMNARGFLAMAFVDRDFDSAQVLEAFGFPPIPRVDSSDVPRELAEIIQKIYLGVGDVLTAEEAREIISTAGADLPGTLEEPDVIDEIPLPGDDQPE